MGLGVKVERRGLRFCQWFLSRFQRSHVGFEAFVQVVKC